MTAIPKISALFETSLASSLSASGSSFAVVSGTDRDGNALSGLYGFIIDEGSADEEFVIGTISGSTVTVSRRGCDADDPETEVSDNKKAHRRGAPVKITDYPILAYLRNILAGTSGYTLPALLRQASTVGDPVDDDDLVRKSYVDHVAAGSFPANRIAVAGNAGETLAAGNLVYLDDTDNEWKKCDADTASTVENVILGIAQGSGTDGNTISSGVLLLGLDTTNTGLTNGQAYYASNTAGALSTTPGTTEVPVGMGTPSGNLYFIPQFAHFITEDQQDALAGTSGTPSNSNKYVTNDDTATAATANKVARRNSTGDITVPATPSASTDAASKGYVDSQTAATAYAWQKVSTQTVSAVSLTSGTTTKIAEWTSLAGDTDDEYLIEYEFVASGTTGNTPVLSLRLNDDSTSGNYSWNNVFISNLSVSANQGSSPTELRIIGGTSNNALVVMVGKITIKASKTIAGTGRYVIAQSGGGTGTTSGTPCNEICSGGWNDTTNQITSVQLYFLQNSGSSRTISGKASLYKIIR